MKRFIPLFVACGAVLICFLFGLNWRTIQRGEMPSTAPLMRLVGLAEPTSAQAPEQVFQANYAKILSDYYKPVTAKDLKYAGMTGLVASLGDPHTMFMPPVIAKEFNQETQGNFVGIGARLDPDPLGAKILVVFDDSPAWKAGVKAGDTITAVEGKSTMGKAVDDIIKSIRGAEGTLVKITLVRPGKKDPFVITARRAEITSPTVEGRYVPSRKLGVLSVVSFSEPTAEQFDTELRKLETNNLQGLVIDLRSNPGGLLEIAGEMLSNFVDGKRVITMRGRGGHLEEDRTPRGHKHLFKYPVVVLVNEDSASAAEIFTGVLRDYRLATIVGTHTYGKASVQNVFPLIDGSVAKITIARYLLPNGQDIGRKVDEDGTFLTGGIEPDVYAPYDIDNPKVKFGDPKTDPQLIKAFSVLASKRSPGR